MVEVNGMVSLKLGQVKEDTKVALEFILQPIMKLRKNMPKVQMLFKLLILINHLPI